MDDRRRRGIDEAFKRREDKVEQGEIVVIVGDRTSATTGERSTRVEFLGKPASFSQGPFILAALLDCPVYFLFCLKDKKTKKYHVIFEHYSQTLKIQIGRAHV